MGEIESLRERQYDLIQISSSSYKILDESIKYDQCESLKNKIVDIQNTLNKFTKGKDNLNLLLGNQMASYDKAGICYEPKKNINSFRNVFNSQQKSKCKILKCNYCNKDSHIVLCCFIKKSHKSKEGYPFSYFYK